MRRLHVARALGVLVALIGLTAGEAGTADNAVAGVGDGGGGGAVEPDPDGGATMTVGLSVTDPGTGARYTADSGSPSPVHYVAIPASRGEGLSVEFLCNAGNVDLTPGEIPWGWRYTIIATETATGHEISREWVCLPITDPENPTAPAPPAVPTPPSIFDIWNSVGIAPPEMHLSPDGEGITGLPTWIWTGGPTTATVGATIGEWSITGTANLVDWTIDPGDGTGIHASALPGDPDHHALDHTYEVKGSYPLVITATWEADVALAGPALPPTPVPIGTAQLTSTRQYTVVEVVPVLLP